MPPRIEPAPLHANVADDIQELRKSHSQLADQVGRLTNELRSSQKIFDSDRFAIFKHLQASDEKPLSRLIKFTRYRAKKALLGPGLEFGNQYTSLCASNSVVQIVLRSQASDCTMHEFQLFAMKLLTDRSIRCSAYPSEYHVKFPNFNRCARLEIVFGTFADMCEALEIDALTREAAIYREKKSRKSNTISVQVLGVENVMSTNRRIFLACNAPPQASEEQITTLFQSSTAWFDGGWECGFHLRSDVASGIYSSSCSPDRRGQSPEISASSKHPNLFSIAWERLESTGEVSCPENVGGALRSYFPAVVLRTQLLTSSARAAFSTPIDGISLQQRLVTRTAGINS